jgi:hypothetical protein
MQSCLLFLKYFRLFVSFRSTRILLSSLNSFRLSLWMLFLANYLDIFTVSFYPFASTQKNIKMFTSLKCSNTSLRPTLLQNTSEFWQFWLPSSACRKTESVRCLRFYSTTFLMKRTSLLSKAVQSCYQISIYLKKLQKDKLSYSGIPVCLVEKLLVRSNKLGKQFTNLYSKFVKAVNKWQIL